MKLKRFIQQFKRLLELNSTYSVLQMKDKNNLRNRSLFMDCDANIDMQFAIDIIEQNLDVSYINYAAIFRILLQTYSLKELVYGINDKSLIERIIHNYKKKQM